MRDFLDFVVGLVAFLDADHESDVCFVRDFSLLRAK
jgi:hypothetical protein